MSKVFTDALIERLEESGRSLRSVCIGADVSYEQMKKVTTGKTRSTNVDDAIRIAHQFGMTLDEFMGDTMHVRRLELLDLYSKLTPQERDFLLTAGRALLAQDQREDE